MIWKLNWYIKIKVFYKLFKGKGGVFFVVIKVDNVNVVLKY